MESSHYFSLENIMTIFKDIHYEKGSSGCKQHIQLNDIGA